MVLFFKPKSTFLTNYIQGFSVFDKDYDLNISYIAFPHIGPPLALFRNATFKFEENHLYINPKKENHFNTLVLGKYTKPVFITYNRFVDEISINFTPLGMNYFFNNNYSEIAPKNFQKIQDCSWNNFVPELFSTKNLDEQLNLLENFLLSQFKEKYLEKLQESVNLFMDKTNDYKVSDVAEIIGITERTLRRNYNKFIGCSPVMFKRIVRFRNAINVKLKKKKIQNITRIGYKYHFYDSSHFVKEYKLFSGKNPKSFFDNISFFENSGYPYILL